MYHKITKELIVISQNLVESLKLLSDTSIKQELIFEHLRTTSKITTNFNLCDFDSGLEWINVSEPLSLHKHLRGKVVVLDFFTYCCINCIHVLPDLKALEDEFSVEDGLVIVGVHSAKFTNERETSNIKSAVERYGVSHPVVNDVECSLWNQLGVTCWPTLYVLGMPTIFVTKHQNTRIHLSGDQIGSCNLGPRCQPLLVLLGEGHGKVLQQFLRTVLHQLHGEATLSHHVLPQIDSEHHVEPTLLRYPGKVAAIHTLLGTRLAVADSGHHRILILDNTGLIQQIVGDGVAGLKDGCIAEARFRSPQGLTFRSPHLLYVADTENHAIREVNLDGGTVRTLVGDGTQGMDKQGGAIWTEQRISSPWDVAFESNTNVLFIAMAGFHQIWALFLCDTTWWKQKRCSEGSCSAIAGSGQEGNRDNNYPMTAAFAQPSGLAIASDHNMLFIADSESSTVRSMRLSDGKVAPVVGGALDPDYLFAFGDCDGCGREAKLQHPLGVAWSEASRVLYVADSYNNKVKRVEPISRRAETLLGGAANTTQRQLNEPGGLCMINDRLYIADTNNHRIAVLDLQTDCVNTFDVRLGKMDDKNENCDNIERHNVHLSLHGGRLSIRAKVTLPTDSKLTADAPSAWHLGLPDGFECHVDESSAKDFSLSQEWLVQVPSESNRTDASKIDVQCSVFYCSDNICGAKKFSGRLDLMYSEAAPILATSNLTFFVNAS